MSDPRRNETQRPDARHTVVVVDDSSVCREIAELILQEHGFEVITVADPFDVGDVLDATSPSLVLLDVMMPGLNGDALVALMRSQKLHGCPFVLHSDAPEDELTRLVRTSGAAGFIRKTANAARFVEQINGFLRAHEAANVAG